MITEDYVSFETAKLLKEKGFDEKVDTLYKTDAEFLKSTLCINYNDAKFALLDMHNIPENTVSAPTLQMAMKWLREVHDAIVNVFYDKDEEKWCAEHYRMLIGDYTLIGYYNTYEEACKVGIKYCLENLI